MKQLLSRANSDEVAGVATMILDIGEKTEFGDQRYKDFMTKLTEANTELIIAQNRKKKSDDSQEVQDLRKSREKAYRALTNSTKGFALRNNETIAASAKLIYEILKRHGITIYKLAHAEQTAKMQSLITEIEMPKNTLALQTSFLKDVFDELTLADEAFLEGIANRNINEASNEEIEKATIARQNTKTLLDQIVNYLNSVSVVDSSSELMELCKSISEIITKANSNIHARINRNENGNNIDEPDEDEEDDADEM